MLKLGYISLFSRQYRTLYSYISSWWRSYICSSEKSLKIPKGESDSIYYYRRRTVNAMTKIKSTKVQTTIYKTSFKSFANIDRPNRSMFVFFKKVMTLGWFYNRLVCQQWTMVIMWDFLSSLPDSTFTLRYFSDNMSTGIFTVMLYRYFKEGRTVLLISPETGRSIKMALDMWITNTGWVCWPTM